MKKWFITAVVFIVVAGIPLSGFAEFFRYKDENGVVRFTDDLAEVPEDQRQKARGYTEPDDFLTPEEREAKRAGKSGEQDGYENADDGSYDGSDEGGNGDADEIARLLEEQSELQDEYLKLRQEEAALRKERAKLKGNKAINDYNKRVADHTKRSLDFEKKKRLLDQAYSDAMKRERARREEERSQKKEPRE